MKNERLLSPRDAYLRAVRRDKIKIKVFQIAFLAIFLALWEALALIGAIDTFFFSSPLDIAKCFVSLVRGEIWRHIGITLYECILGFLISTVAGTLIAVALWWSDTLRRVSEPYLVVLNALPKIALGPIIIIWVGAGAGAIILMAFLICIIVTVMSVLSGFLSVDGGQVFLLRSMGASKAQILFKLVLPHSVPTLLSVIKINVGLSWVGTIMGEYLVSGAGLGYLIIYGGQVFKLDLVMTSTFILCVLAALMYLVVAIIEKRVKRFK